MRVGFCFGLVSGVITTLGLLVGLNAGTGSKLVVIGGILTIAIADSFSDALGIHISEESEGKHTTKEVWESTLTTLLSKFFFALIFLVPLLLLPLQVAVLASVAWGLIVLAALSYFIAREQHTPAWRVISEHVFVAVIVIGLAELAGSWIASVFGSAL
jgi:VIT1/CCC1 family predicted Fe2+/Mn2+ transporter